MNTSSNARYFSPKLGRDCFRLAIGLVHMLGLDNESSCHVLDLGDCWEICVNTSTAEHKHQGWTVAPLSCHVIWRGWPVGIVTHAGSHVSTYRDPYISLLSLGERLHVAIEYAEVGHLAAGWHPSAN